MNEKFDWDKWSKLSAYEKLEALDPFMIAEEEEGGGYENHGYKIMVYENEAYFFTFSHCSCYGTAECLELEGAYTISDMNYDWSGSLVDLYNIVKNKKDINMPNKTIDKTDYDYKMISGLYYSAKIWLEKNIYIGKENTMDIEVTLSQDEIKTAILVYIRNEGFNAPTNTEVVFKDVHDDDKFCAKINVKKEN